MTKVHIIEKFNTSFVTVLLTDNTERFNVGEKITCDNGCNYTIIGIQMGTRPTEDNRVFLVVN